MNKINEQAKKYAKEQLGEVEFNHNKDARNVIMDDFKTGAKWQLKEFTSVEASTNRNAIVVSNFIEHCKREGVTIPENVFETFFNA